MKSALAITALMCALWGSCALADPALPSMTDTLVTPELPVAPDTLAVRSVPVAPAKKPAKASDRSDKVPHRIPMVAMALSGVFPGGGQLYTQKYYRAVIFAGAIGYFGYGYYREDKAMNREVNLANSAESDADFMLHQNNYYAHYDNRRTFQWWGVGALLFSMIDAYIDAHMFKFDERAEPAITLRATPTSLALSAKF